MASKEKSDAARINNAVHRLQDEMSPTQVSLAPEAIEQRGIFP